MNTYHCAGRRAGWQPGLALLLGLGSTFSATAQEAPATMKLAAVTAPRAKAAPLWSYQPVQQQAVPAVNRKRWMRTPIDAFILAALEAKGLEPSADADRATFIRRATLDAWGVIPSPADVEAFIKDRSATAHERVVDRLLAAPQFGERQARGAGPRTLRP